MVLYEVVTDHGYGDVFSHGIFREKINAINHFRKEFPEFNEISNIDIFDEDRLNYIKILITSD